MNVRDDWAPSSEDPAFAGELALRTISWSGPQLSVGWSVDRLQFVTTLWYDSIRFDDLERRYGRLAAASLALHVAMFQLNTGISFGPSRLRIAEPWRALLTVELFELWRTVARKVWAQWRFEHHLPDYSGPEPVGPLHPSKPLRLAGPGSDMANLWFCGGGKDSLLASHLLTEIGEPYDALQYSHSIYGRQDVQSHLIDRVVERSAAGRRHRIHMFDTSTSLPLPELSPYRGVRSIVAAETPGSLFAALPVALAHGYRHLMVAHERSANVGNLVWSVTGEEVNHQWGKSLEADGLLSDYIREQLAPSIEYFSVLQPVNDALIFGSLREIVERLPAAHSCNRSKPWCMRCAKCAYVWICYKAWLPWPPVDATFGDTNLLDLDENQRSYRQLLGLEQHTPFECVGQIDEVRLAFMMAKARGLEGRAMTYLEEIGALDVDALVHRYLRVHDHHHIPGVLAPRVLAFFRGRSEDAHKFAAGVLAGQQ